MNSVPLHGWGRHPLARADLRLSEDLEAITASAALSRGLGRAYGDAALPARTGDIIAGTRLADRILAFDARTGVLRAEAGLSLATIHALFLERGWSSPVVPGTRHVTLGGMVAADVHGKNHHVAGSFGEHVSALRLRTGAGAIVEVGEAQELELFRATLGGMGLTGHILEVELRLSRVPSPWIVEETESAPGLDALLERLAVAGRDWPFTVAWADALARGGNLGRGIVIKGRWAEPGEAKGGTLPHERAHRVPFDAPNLLLNRPSIAVFNAIYYRSKRGATRRVVPPGPFFHPLDAVGDWNRLYGRRGFTQYQCVLPAPGGAATSRLFGTLADHGINSFLAVIKDFGAAGRGMLSFPMPGLTVALDLPLDSHTAAAVEALNAVTAEAGGRIYLAKDALTRRERFLEMEGARLARWDAVRRHWDPETRLRSALSARLMGDV